MYNHKINGGEKVCQGESGVGGGGEGWETKGRETGDVKDATAATIYLR